MTASIKAVYKTVKRPDTYKQKEADHPLAIQVSIITNFRNRILGHVCRADAVTIAAWSPARPPYPWRRHASLQHAFSRKSCHTEAPNKFNEVHKQVPNSSKKVPKTYKQCHTQYRKRSKNVKELLTVCLLLLHVCFIKGIYAQSLILVNLNTC